MNQSQYTLISKICYQVFRLADSDGGAPISFCALRPNGSIILLAAMDEVKEYDTDHAWRCAKTALFVGGYTELLETRGFGNMGSTTPSFFVKEGGGVVIRSGEDAGVVYAFGVAGREGMTSKGVRNNHELAYWAAQFVPSAHAVATLKEYQRLWIMGTLPREVKESQKSMASGV